MGQMRGTSWSAAAWCHRGIVVLGIFTMTTFSLASAAQYSVGDAAGWVLNVNYTDWAAKHTFQEGDTVVFSYPRGEHDVLRVNAQDYNACKASNPIETDASGQTTFVLQAEPYYFICGFPAHCDEFEQKVSFNVAPAPGSTEIPSNDIPYTQAAESPLAVTPASVPSPAGAFGAAPAMARPALLQSLILLACLGVLLGSGSSIL
ncbi:unnamed protein product [Calypogeia fissa]